MKSCLDPDRVRAFAIRLAVAYGVLILPWPGLSRGFAALYRGSVNAFLSVTRLSDYVVVEPPPENQLLEDAELSAMNPRTGQRLRMGYSARAWGYLPLAAATALLVAVPPPFPRRMRAGLILLGGIIVFIGLRTVVAAVYGLGSVGVFSMGATGQKLLGAVLMAFSATPIASYVVPVILWLLALHWTFDWQVESSSSAPEHAA